MNILLTLLLISSININTIEDGNTLYLMDKDVSYYMENWVNSYISNEYGIRTSQGCLDIERWEQQYGAKFLLPINKSFDIRYNFYKIDGYNWHKEIHQLDFNYFIKHLVFSLSISPNYLKMDDYMGLGVGLYNNYKQNIQFFINLKDFDHNYATNRLYRDTIHDPYISHPFQFELKSNYSFSSGYINFDVKKTMLSTKKIMDKDSLIGYINSEDGDGYLYAYINIFNRFDIYNVTECKYESYREDRFNYHTSEKMLTFFTSTSLNYKFKYGTAHMSIPFYYKSNNIINSDDSLTYNYRKKMYGLTVSYIKDIFKFMSIGFGYQRGLRERLIDDIKYSNGYGDCENRLIASLEFNFNDKTRLKVIEGIELDKFPHIPITRFHNHTYVLIQFSP